MRGRFFISTVLLLITGLFFGSQAGAISVLPDEVLTVTGYLRGEADFHTGSGNPNNANQPDYNRWNLFQTTMMTDINWKPSEHFKMFGKVKFQGDFTDKMDPSVLRYNAYPGYQGSGSGFRTGIRSDNGLAEVRDVYGDISIGNLWVRAGKQQIVWGEADAIRLLDVFNPLDLTKRLFINPAPEQFQDIRIPVWALRATYSVPNRLIEGLAIEGVLNPGDFVPTTMPVQGAPYNIVPTAPGYVSFSPENQRGNVTGGGRVLGKVGGVNVTLNYLYTYSQDAILVNKGLVADPLNGIRFFPGGPLMGIQILEAHPKVNIYGASFNYAWEGIKSVVRGEMTFTPDQPYESRRGLPGQVAQEYITRPTFKYVLGIDKSIAVLPLGWTPSMMSSSLQFVQTMRSGDPQFIAINQAPVDKVDNMATLYLSQPFMNETITGTFLAVYDFHNAFWIQPGVKYKPGNHWIFDIYSNILGGTDQRAYKFGALEWASGVFGRVTYQF